MLRKRSVYLVDTTYQKAFCNLIQIMYNNENHGKIKNDKVLRWRMELSEFAFDIAYRSGKLNAAPDALSRVYCAAMRENTLYNIHVSLCHPGVTRLIMFAQRIYRTPSTTCGK